MAFAAGFSTGEGYKTFSKRGIVLPSFRMPTDENPLPVCLTLRFQIAAVSRTGRKARRKTGDGEGVRPESEILVGVRTSEAEFEKLKPYRKRGLRRGLYSFLTPLRFALELFVVSITILEICQISLMVSLNSSLQSCRYFNSSLSFQRCVCSLEKQWLVTAPQPSQLPLRYYAKMRRNQRPICSCASWPRARYAPGYPTYASNGVALRGWSTDGGEPSVEHEADDASSPTTSSRSWPTQRSHQTQGRPHPRRGGHEKEED